MIFRCVWDTISNGGSCKTKTNLTSHIQIENLSQKVRREAHRVKGFIRFQQTGEDQYFALIAPQYDVLSLIRRHFQSRFADQRWIIYDRLRNYGLCYDRDHVRELRLDPAELKAFGNEDIANEQFCQTLWKRYYDAVNIRHRNNPRLHVKQLPRRFWQYLPEKKN
jgi:probable DNA metabolism protein